MDFSIETEPLTADSFSPFGQVIEFTQQHSNNANQGTAKRLNYLAQLSNLRPETATPNLCIFRVSPLQSHNTFQVRLLERHPYSTQAFIPMCTTASGYMVIVCPNDSKGKRL